MRALSAPPSYVKNVNAAAHAAKVGPPPIDCVAEPGYTCRMAILLELPPTLEGTLQRQAEFRGVPVAQFTAKWIEQHFPAAQPRTLTAEQIEERFQRGMKIVKACQALPRLDGRTADEIIGYDSYGLPA